MAGTAEWTEETAVDWRDGLLATKLHVPRTPPGFLSRPRLVQQLEKGLARELVLVCAPAGFGKTVLLADWSQVGKRPVAWLSLDAGDNDPVRFWRHAIATLDRLRPGIADQVGSLLARPGLASVDGVVTALVNELATAHGDALLILDDYDVIHAEQVHRSLMVLLEHPPPGLHLVLASRSDPPMPLARMRGRGQLAELRSTDLRFNSEEAAALLRMSVGSALDDEAAATLAARSEGWAAGLQLAALSLRGQVDISGFVTAFSGTHRYVLDYLTEEVLGGQPEPVRTFLLETSVLNRLSGPLCDAVTERAGSQAMLEEIEHSNLLLVPLDEVRGWWRYHHLFADLLRARLHQQEPLRVQELHRNAATWSEAHGLSDDAVHYALAAADPVWAAQLIERHADARILRGEVATVRRWLADLPANLAASRPRLLLVRTLLSLLTGQVEPVESLLERAERFADSADDPFEPSVGKAASALANVPAAIALDRAHLAELRGDADRAIHFGQQALDLIGDRDSMLGSIAEARLAVAYWLGGRLGDAERGLSASIEGWQAAGEHYLAVRGCYYLGLVHRAQGRLDAALRTYERALEIATPREGPALPAAGAAHVGIAEVAYQRDELDVAMRHVTDGIEICRQLPFTQPLATGLVTLAWIRQATGDADGALDAVSEAEQVPASPDLADLLNLVPVQRARLLLSQGNVPAVAQWIEERGLSVDDEVSYPREPAYLLLVRFLLATDAADRALGLLARLDADAAAHDRWGSLIEIHALRALALAAVGREVDGSKALAEAVRLASPQRYIRVFVDEGEAMGRLLGRLVAAGMDQQPITGRLSMNGLARIARAFDAATAHRPGTGTTGGVRLPPLVVTLSEREQEVLRLLAAGKQNQEIAEELYVTRDTVKKHVTHILDKLGVSNRTQATVRARELGLLQ
jgi:LuxR family maltose regulon positive regulatory protein